MSQLRAPLTGQLELQAPHSGPLNGKQYSSEIFAMAILGRGITSVCIFSSLSSLPSSGNLRAFVSQALTQGQSSHR